MPGTKTRQGLRDPSKRVKTALEPGRVERERERGGKMVERKSGKIFEIFFTKRPGRKEVSVKEGGIFKPIFFRKGQCDT